MKKTYEAPQMENIVFLTEDIANGIVLPGDDISSLNYNYVPNDRV